MAEDCSETAQAISDLVDATAQREDMKSFDDVVGHITSEFPELSREDIRQSVLEAQRARASDARKAVDTKFAAIKREAISEGKTRETIAKLESLKKSGAFEQPTPKQAKQVNDTLAALKQQTSKLNRDSKLRQRIDEMTQALETGVLPEVKGRIQTPIDDTEALRLEIQRDKLTQAIRAKREALKPQGLGRRILNAGFAVQSVSRTLQTILHPFSAIGRQGGLVTLGNPVEAIKSIGPTLKALSDPVKSLRVMKDIEAGPNYPIMQKAGLVFTNPEGPPGAHEELFDSPIGKNLLDNIPGSKLPGKLAAASARGFSTYLNVLKATVADKQIEGLGRPPTLEEAQVLAKALNVATGRSTALAAQTFRDLSVAFYSPRFLASRFQYMAGGLKSAGDAVTGFKFGDTSTAAARKIVAANYAKTAIGFGSMIGLGMLMGGKVEADPRSSDFLKLRFGNTTIDVSAGILTLVTAISKLAAGSVKKYNGTVVPIRGPSVPFGGQTSGDIVGSQIRNHLAPAASAIADLGTGKMFDGSPATLGKIAGEAASPFGIPDAYAALKEQGLEKGAIMSLLALTGYRVSTFEPRAHAPKSPQYKP